MYLPQNILRALSKMKNAKVNEGIKTVYFNPDYKPDVERKIADLAKGEYIEIAPEHLEDKPCRPVKDSLPMEDVLSKGEVPDTDWVSFHLDEGTTDYDTIGSTVVTIYLASGEFGVEHGASGEIRYARELLERYGLRCDEKTLAQQIEAEEDATAMNEVEERTGSLLSV